MEERFLRRLAEASETTPARAADQLDQIVSKVLKSLRDGKTARIPGLGDFAPGPRPEFRDTKVNTRPTSAEKGKADARNGTATRGRR